MTSSSFFGAFNQDRTGDLILTMDALYLLSYKGRCVFFGTTYSLPSMAQKVKQKHSAAATIGRKKATLPDRLESWSG